VTDVRHNGRAAIVIDDLASINPGAHERSRFVAALTRSTGRVALIRIYPDHIVSWALNKSKTKRELNRSSRRGSIGGRNDRSRAGDPLPCLSARSRDRPHRPQGTALGS
jgi:hypothetical protein